MNYTKGEWETGQATVKGLSDDTKHIAVAVGSKIIALNGIVAAFDERESKSNAYLIAAAPDMYEALKTAITTIQYLHNMGFPSESQKMMWALYQKSPEMTKINAALAKAEVKDA